MPTHDITQILAAIGDGDSKAANDLLPLVYDELRRLARAQLSQEPAGQTLQPTALVHEAYLRLVGRGTGEELRWESRGHFFAAAARAMRHLLVERARTHGRLKRGGDRRREPFAEDTCVVEPADVDLLALDEALDRFEAHDRRRSQIVMLRYFAGLSIEETAAALAVSATTVKSDWNYAKAWLHRDMTRTGVAE